jgi:hypothetical protein
LQFYQLEFHQLLLSFLSLDVPMEMLFFTPYDRQVFAYLQLHTENFEKSS